MKMNGSSGRSGHTVEVVIDELVLEGFSAVDAQRVRDAFESELHEQINRYFAGERFDFKGVADRSYPDTLHREVGIGAPEVTGREAARELLKAAVGDAWRSE